MSNRKDGGSAFPYSEYGECGHCGKWVDPKMTQDGMSLRDYFAAAALQGMLNHNSAFDAADHAAHWAYQFADAMLAERDK